MSYLGAYGRYICSGNSNSINSCRTGCSACNVWTTGFLSVASFLAMIILGIIYLVNISRVYSDDAVETNCRVEQDKECKNPFDFIYKKCFITYGDIYCYEKSLSGVLEDRFYTQLESNNTCSGKFRPGTVVSVLYNSQSRLTKDYLSVDNPYRDELNLAYIILVSIFGAAICLCFMCPLFVCLCDSCRGVNVLDYVNIGEDGVMLDNVVTEMPMVAPSGAPVAENTTDVIAKDRIINLATANHCMIQKEEMPFGQLYYKCPLMSDHVVSVVSVQSARPHITKCPLCNIEFRQPIYRNSSQ